MQAKVGIVNSSGNRLALPVGLYGLALLVGMGMATRPMHGDEHADVAVLQSRSDAIDKHLQSTDFNADRMAQKVAELSSSLSEMQGEERVAWAVISVLCGSSLVVQFRGKRG